MFLSSSLNKNQLKNKNVCISVYIVLFGYFSCSIPSPGWTVVCLISLLMMDIQVVSIVVTNNTAKPHSFT